MPAKKTPVNTPTNSMHEDLVREYVDIQDRIGPDLARAEEIKKVLRDLDYGTHELAGLKVSVARNVRLNAARFMAAYPVMQRPELYKSAPDAAAIKEQLAPAEIAKFQDEGEKRVSVK